MSRADRAFEGRELFEAMDAARRYNAFLEGRILRAAGEAGRVLDFGAGTGRFARALAERGFEVHAVEPDPVLREGLERGGLSAKRLNVHAAIEDATGGPFAFAYSVNVLEHIEDDRAALAALAGRLAPGGRLFLYVPAFPALWTANDTRVGHVRRYRKATLLPRLAEAGLDVEDARYVDSLGALATLAYRWGGRLGWRRGASGDLSPRSVALYDRWLFPVSRALDAVLAGAVGKNLMVEAVRR